MLTDLRNVIYFETNDYFYICFYIYDNKYLVFRRTTSLTLRCVCTSEINAMTGLIVQTLFTTQIMWLAYSLEPNIPIYTQTYQGTLYVVRCLCVHIKYII